MEENSNINENIEKNSNVNETPKKKKKKKHRFLKILLIILIIFAINKCLNIYKSTLDKIYIMNKEIYGKKDDSNFYKISEKVEKINLKIKTFKTIEKTKIRLYSNNLIILEKEYIGDKKWEIEELSLPLGVSHLEIETILEEGETIKRNIAIYNMSADNLGKLSVEDNDNDELLNYQEDMYTTNKDLSDSDNDGLSDYEEICYTQTSPVAYSTFNENLSDAESDSDLDGLTNKQELELKTNPIKSDTDNDGLSDYEEVKEFNTNPLMWDTDEEGVSDYDEIKNFNTSPTSKTYIFSGKVESKNKEVGIILNNISIEDLEKTKFEISTAYILNENMAGYIMPAYDISTSVNFENSKIIFNFENYDVEENAIPTIYYFNEKTEKLEELPTIIEGKLASTTVTHFSTYILIDKNKFDNINQVDSESSEINATEFVSGEFLFYYSPIATVFADLPIYIIASADFPEEQAEIFREKFNIVLENDYPVNITIIKSKTGFKILKAIFDAIYKFLYTFIVSEREMDYLFSTSNISDKSYVHNIGNAFIIGYLKDTEDLGQYFVNENNENIFKNNYILIDLDDKTDTNQDGISDAFTKAILSGKITTYTGINPFEGYSLKEIQENNDLDKDGIKNGEEIQIEESLGKYYINMISNPSLKDSDNDGLKDPEDAEPLYAITSGFAIGKSLNEEIDVSYYEKEVESYNSLFGTGENVKIDGEEYIKYQENGETKYSPTGFINAKGEIITAITTGGAMVGNIIGAGDAEKARTRYYECNAKTYTERDIIEKSIITDGEINPNSIYGSQDVQEFMARNSKKLIKIAENNIKDSDTKVIKTTKTLTGSGYLQNYDQNLNVFGFLHGSSAHMISEITNNNGEYVMKLRYIIIDIYDWKNSEECDLNNPAGVTEVHYYNEMLLGKAKAFLVQIEYDMEVRWKKGEEPTIKLLEGTPYK